MINDKDQERVTRREFRSVSERWQGVPPLPPDIRERLSRLPALFATYEVGLAYLFGWLLQTRSVPRTPQDVDLALLMAPDQHAVTLVDGISTVLDTRRIDIVDLGTASPLLRFHIVSDGERLYAADEDLQLDFELETVRHYQDAAWLRRQQTRMLKERLAPWLSVEM